MSFFERVVLISWLFYGQIVYIFKLRSFLTGLRQLDEIFCATMNQRDNMKGA